jgi:hypothetical protein
MSMSKQYRKRCGSDTRHVGSGTKRLAIPTSDAVYPVPLSRPKPSKTIIAWLAFWAGFAALDYAADKRGQSLSSATRRLFRTETCTGRAVFSACHWAGAWVLYRHIVKR